MRRTDKEISTRKEIDAIIKSADVCRLAFAVSDEPYLVPVSFGYDGSSLYFHTAKTGKKIDCIAANNRVCFELEHDVRLVRHADAPCKWSFSFESVIGFGSILELLSPAQKEQGLNRIMEHYSGKEWNYPEASITSVRVWQISITSISGKRAVEKEA